MIIIPTLSKTLFNKMQYLCKFNNYFMNFTGQKWSCFFARKSLELHYIIARKNTIIKGFGLYHKK